MPDLEEVLDNPLFWLSTQELKDLEDGFEKGYEAPYIYNGAYEDVLSACMSKELLQNGGNALIDRLKPEHLPLFINTKWATPAIKEKFLIRLKNG